MPCHLALETSICLADVADNVKKIARIMLALKEYITFCLTTLLKVSWTVQERFDKELPVAIRFTLIFFQQFKEIRVSYYHIAVLLEACCECLLSQVLLPALDAKSMSTSESIKHRLVLILVAQNALDRFIFVTVGVRKWDIDLRMIIRQRAIENQPKLYQKPLLIIMRV